MSCPENDQSVSLSSSTFELIHLSTLPPFLVHPSLLSSFISLNRQSMFSSIFPNPLVPFLHESLHSILPFRNSTCTYEGLLQIPAADVVAVLDEVASEDFGDDDLDHHGHCIHDSELDDLLHKHLVKCKSLIFVSLLFDILVLHLINC